MDMSQNPGFYLGCVWQAWCDVADLEVRAAFLCYENVNTYSWNITYEREKIQFFGVRVRFGHLECPRTKQTKQTSAGSLLSVALMTKRTCFGLSHTLERTLYRSLCHTWLQNLWVYCRRESKGHIAKYNSSLLNLFHGSKGSRERGQPGAPLSCAGSRF